MKKNILIGSLALFFLSASQLAWPAPTENYKPRSESYPESTWYLFGGIDLGFSHYSPYNSSVTEAPRQGPDIGIRALIAHYSYDWVIDGGFGFQYINNNGTNFDQSVNTDKTTNVYVDLSPRYRLDRARHWQIGPEFEYWLTTDKGLNPTPIGSNLILNGSNTSGWAGVQALYEWQDGHKFRVGARGLTDVIGVDSRTVFVVQAFFQMGFDAFSGHSSPANSDEDYTPMKHYERLDGDDLARTEDQHKNDALVMTPEPTPWPSVTPAEPEAVVLSTPAPPEPETMATPVPVVAAPLPTPEPPVIKKQKIIFTMDVNDLPFGFDNANLPPAHAERMKKVGTFLNAHNGLWKSLTVAGHTDERGSKAYNMNLSKRRAETVRNLLIEGGAKAKKIKAIGYGKSRPRDKHHTETAWARNRRVEMEFNGVKDMRLMKKGMTR